MNNRSSSPRRQPAVNNPRGYEPPTLINPSELNQPSNVSRSPRRTRRQAGGSEATDSTPLMETENINPRPPIARGEDDELDDRETVNQPYPGVDDGFFTPANGNGNGNNVPEVEIIPNTPVDEGKRIPAYPQPGNNQPRDRTPERRPSLTPTYPNSYIPGSPDPHFPYSPGFGPEYHPTGTFPDIAESIPDVNVYQHKKTLAQGMMDLALFSANANQLRYVLESYDRHPYYYPSVVFISISLMLQVAIGVGLIWNARYNVKDDKEICIANKISNFTIIGIFIVTVINVFISAFGVASAPAPTPLITPRFGNFEDAPLNLTVT